MLLFSACMLACALSAPQTEQPTNSFPSSVGSTEPINGRLWSGRPIIGGMPGSIRNPTQDDAARYGAFGEGGITITVETPGLFAFESMRLAEVRPFEPVTDALGPGNSTTNPFNRASRKLAAALEDARQRWLKDNNYVGGVRTFVNDAALLPDSSKKATQLPTPRGVIELAPDAPRFKSRMRVETDPPKHRPGTRTSSVIKVLPKDPPKPAEAPGTAGPELKTAAK